MAGTPASAHPSDRWYLSIDCATKSFAWALLRVRDGEALRPALTALAAADTPDAIRAAFAVADLESKALLHLAAGGAADLVPGKKDAAIPAVERVRAVVALRLEQNHAHKEAIRRALAVLALRGRASAAAACTARTVDAIWHAAGDTSADFSWYTKRAILASVYTSTLLFWLRDSSEADAATLEFLDRRLAGVGGIGKLRKRAEAVVERFVPARLRSA